MSSEETLMLVVGIVVGAVVGLIGHALTRRFWLVCFVGIPVVTGAMSTAAIVAHHDRVLKIVAWYPAFIVTGVLYGGVAAAFVGLPFVAVRRARVSA